MKKRLFMLTFAAVTGATGACAQEGAKNPRRPIKATRIRLFGARYSAASAAPSAACDSAALRITSVR